MRFIYVFMVLIQTSLIGIVVKQAVTAVTGSADTGLFIGLFVFVAIAWTAFASNKPNVKGK